MRNSHGMQRLGRFLEGDGLEGCRDEAPRQVLRGASIVHCCLGGRTQVNLGTRISYHEPISPTVVGPPKATGKP